MAFFWCFKLPTVFYLNVVSVGCFFAQSLVVNNTVTLKLHSYSSCGVFVLFRKCHIGNRVVNELDPKGRELAIVFQSYGLYPKPTFYENIRFLLKVRKVDPATHML